jgi:nucleotide-binding universal stress UspA family protein
MRSILLYVHDDAGLEARLQVALDLCRALDGHLSCLQATPYDLGVAGDFYYPVTAQLASQLEQEAKDIGQRLETRLANEDVRWDWIRTSGLAQFQIPRIAPLHDLLVIGSTDPLGIPDRPSKLVSDLVSQIRLPVLNIPSSVNSLHPDSTAVVAWNGSPEAAHALRAAIPLLIRAANVQILTVREQEGDEKFDMPPTGAAKYLARHGVEARIVELPHAAGSSIAEILLDAAEKRNAAYMVMGAYGHSRLRERILGGVTREMLSAPSIPLFLYH